MKDYYNFVKEYLGVSECFVNKKYCNVGHTFCVNNDEIEGLYWFYETENFIIDIHDFFAKKEIIHTSLQDIKNFMTFSSSYIISASGESFNPYQTLSANSLYILDIENLEKNYRFLLHENSMYLGIAVNFKPQMIKDCLSSMKISKNISYSHIFQDTKAIITNSLEPIAKDILNCKMVSPAAEMFFEAKAKEWISIVIDAFLNKKEIHISSDDNIALENVANYLDDHYALDVSQKTLEKIAMMSGTKLKKLFKEKYQCSITEYTQRKRMNMAENLLLNSTLRIQDIAEAVGYSSHSKFTACYKKYKGIYPKDAKKYLSRKNSTTACIYDENI
ncbi:helix-turn-helix domain-containing protein [Helcococcus ovis]|uniref:helix-turn-helix domain-containing protein n=1 Tax=Helcococcus ovis TaxID=72026 RepID=UPI0038B9AD03